MGSYAGTAGPTEQRHHPTTGMLLRLLAEGAQRRARLIAATGRPESAVAQALTTLKHRGLVARLQYGLWTLTEAGREHVQRLDANP